MAQVKIHRGTHQIGGCSTEISTENNRVFIDFGDNLSGVVALPLQIDGLTFGNSSASALFFTHYHGDHVGRLADVLPDVPVYMGKTAKAIQINLEERRNRGGTSLFARALTLLLSSGENIIPKNRQGIKEVLAAFCGGGQ